MSTPCRQRGMTLVGWMFTLALIGFAVMLAIKLVPVYVDGYKVSSSMDSLRTDTASVADASDLRRRLLKRLDINMVSDVKPQDISIERLGNALALNVNYEVREHLFGNLDLVVSFDKTTEVPVRP